MIIKDPGWYELMCGIRIHLVCMEHHLASCVPRSLSDAHMTEIREYLGHKDADVLLPMLRWNRENGKLVQRYWLKKPGMSIGRLDVSRDVDGDVSYKEAIKIAREIVEC